MKPSAISAQPLALDRPPSGGLKAEGLPTTKRNTEVEHA